MPNSPKFRNWSRPFLLDPASGAQWTYAELERDSAQLANRSQTLRFESWYRYLVELVAALRGSDSVALLPSGLSPQSPKASQVEAAEGPIPAKSPVQPLPLDESLLVKSDCRFGIATSGTSGSPKLVWHELETLTRGIRQSEKHRDDLWGLAYHPTHFAGLQVILQALANGNSLVILFGLAPAQIHTTIENSKLTHLSATPTFYRMICTPDAPTHPLVRRVTVGGERTSASLLKILQRVFPNARITNLYASTEAGTLLASVGEGFRIPSGLIDRVRVRNEELEVHHSLLARSLRESADHTQHTENGFFRTGDRVEWINDGETFRIVGRTQEQLNIGGFKVNPGEIEDTVCSYPEVAAARVFGRPNSVTGMLLCCDVVLRQPHTLTTKELRQRLSEKFPTYKVPGLVNFVESIGQTYSGKQAKQG
jgi:acyl-CoA synthetase (AMP-forming)/AMP-acid ligase II